MKIKNFQRFLDDDFDAVEDERIELKIKDRWIDEPIERMPLRQSEKNTDFRCAQCKAAVSSDHAISGVNNRNHCPHCLWSKHVDLHKPGDRLAECRSRMQPIGLTLKRTLKKYGDEMQGELMLIHRCTGCGKLSINRIAADDDPQVVVRIFQAASDLDMATLNVMRSNGITPLGSDDIATVLARLFGRQVPIEGRAGLRSAMAGT